MSGLDLIAQQIVRGAAHQQLGVVLFVEALQARCQIDGISQHRVFHLEFGRAARFQPLPTTTGPVFNPAPVSKRPGAVTISVAQRTARTG